MASSSKRDSNSFPLALFLLGTFRLERNGQTIHLPTHKIESLFAFLVLHPEPHPREKLAALFWGDSSDEHARRSLRTALAALHKELGADVLLADRETVQFNPECSIWVDVKKVADWKLQSDDAENLKSKIENYAGDLLPDFYDDWILPEREHLRLIYLDALLHLTQHYRAQSKYSLAMEIAQQVLATDPANEKAYQHLIFCLAAMGDRAQALKQYAECERVLHAELNVAPSRETMALCAQIQAEITGGQSREAWMTNLPAPLTSFIGREKEKSEIKEMLQGTRLLTLIGAGGCGKTRLAIQVGTELAAAHTFKHGIWWVDLSALKDPAHVLHSVATVFNLQESESLPMLALLSNFLRTKELLLILDNCEQVIDACVQFVGTVLPACPNLRVLATSRERLNASGEFMWYVPSMTLPPLDLPFDQLRQYDAIQLFRERARAIASHWSLVGNGATVTRICTQLDGIPLAIELAAARLNVLSVEQIAERLANRFDLLTGGSHTELPRHQTLRATIDWSYDLLSETERIAFRQLAVFAGGWTLEAAEAILSHKALDYLTALIDKSLVVVEQKGNATRYRYLETIRQYAYERLVELGEINLIRDSHLDFYLAFAKQAEPKLHGSEQLQWLDRLDFEHDNVREALEWSLQVNAEKGMKLVWSLRLFLEYRGHWSEGKEWTDKLLACSQVSPKNLAYANGLLVAGILNIKVGDPKAARRALEELVVVAREFGEAGKQLLALGLCYLTRIVFSDDPLMAESMLEEGLSISRAIDVQWVTVRLLEQQADVFTNKHNLTNARQALEEALAISQWMGDKFNSTYIMGRIGRLSYKQRDNVTARRYAESSLLAARETRDRPNISRNLIILGEINRTEGKYDLAKRDYTEALEVARELGSMRLVMTNLENLAEVALYEGECGRAKMLFAEYLELAQKRKFKLAIASGVMGCGGALATEKKAFQAIEILSAFQTFLAAGDSRIPSPVEEIAYQRYLALARSQLDEATFNAAWAEGCKMTLEQALEYALENVK